MRPYRDLYYRDGYSSADIKYLKSYEPFAVVCEYSDLLAHREEIFKELAYVRWDKLVAHHTDSIELMHYTHPDNVFNILSNGIELGAMNAMNDFGQSIHCFTSNCPDAVWGDGFVPIYFDTDEWWQVIANSDGNFGLRHCIVCEDINKVRLATNVTPITSVEYMRYFGYSVDEFVELFPLASTGEFVDIATAHNDGRDATEKSLARTQLVLLGAPSIYVDSEDTVKSLYEYRTLLNSVNT